MENLEGREYRKQVVERLNMSADEQDHCWLILNDIESALLNRDNVACDKALKKLDQRLAGLRA